MTPKPSFITPDALAAVKELGGLYIVRSFREFPSQDPWVLEGHITSWLPGDSMSDPRLVILRTSPDGMPLFHSENPDGLWEVPLSEIMGELAKEEIGLTPSLGHLLRGEVITGAQLV